MSDMSDDDMGMNEPQMPMSDEDMEDGDPIPSAEEEVGKESNITSDGGVTKTIITKGDG